jgi:ectoine hydroxylase-related dioxygenase (phytanoyl-CoA dioxygenase family)
MYDETANRLAALDEQGFALLPAVLSAHQVHQVKQAIDNLVPVHWDYTGLVDHYKCVFNRDPFWLEYLDAPGVIELAEAALGSDCHIIGQTAWRCHPGFIGADLHVDYLPIALPQSLLGDPSFHLPMQVCTAMVYLDEIDEALCPTLVVPGSHRSGRVPMPGETHWNGKQAEPVLCRAGDVLFLRSDIWHAGSRNATTDRTRYLLQVHYGRRMIAQKFSPYLSFSFNPTVLAGATSRQRRLLGEHLEAEYD